MPNTHSTLTSLFQDIADAIRQKTGQSSSNKITADDFPTAIQNIPTSGGSTEVEEKDVNFHDYDGTRLYSYTAQEFAQLSAMPANPSHTGLTAQGWNWTLADAKAQVASEGYLIIGQNYVTSDGKTRIYIDIYDELLKHMSLYFKCSTDGGVTIDWGDGNTTVSTSTVLKTYTHDYSALGQYIITLTVASGSTLTIAWSSSTFSLTGDANQLRAGWVVKRIELGQSVITGDHSFKSLRHLEYITIPSGVSVGQYCFRDNTSLKFCVVPHGPTSLTGTFMSCAYLSGVSFPKSVTNIGISVCQQCFHLKYVSIPYLVDTLGSSTFVHNVSLRRINIPNGVTVLPTSFLNTCMSIQQLTLPNSLTTINGTALSLVDVLSLTIPSTVTNIATGAMTSTYMDLHMLSTTPPTLASSSALSNNPGRIYVPKSENQTVLNAYKTATNWSSYASRIYEEP